MKSEIVISGISGKYPDAENVAELWEKLFNKVDLVTDEERRWVSDFYGIPKRMGQLKDISKFDNLFFGIHHRLAKDLDPQGRILLEVTYEAMADAGYDPDELRGKNIGVYIGNCSIDSSYNIKHFLDLEQFDGYGLLGSSQALLANRISYTFDFKGPSYTLETSSSSGAMALLQAFQAIRRGDCDAAIVGASSVLLRPEISLSYHKLKMLSSEGKSKPFDATCDGFVRSEGVVSFFIQKSEDARRNYASIVHMKACTDGFKAEGITAPSSEIQKNLMSDALKECNMDPHKISYLEASAEGSPAADVAEVKAIKEVFCNNREEPLLVGSVKSNIGHTEPVSGLCGITKIILAFEKGILPANLHFNEPVTELKSAPNGSIKVIAEPTPWNGQYAAFNSFSYGGLNVHGLLRRSNITSQEKVEKENAIPQLMLFCGRTKEAVQTLFDSSTFNDAPREFFALVHKLAYSPPKIKKYRGFKLRKEAESIEEIKLIPPERRPVWYVFSGMGSQWPAMAKSLMQIDTFAKSIRKSAEILKPYIPDLEGMVTTRLENDTSTDCKTDKRSIIPAFVSIAAVQIALVDVLNELNLKPDGIVGHSVGELGCAYADGCFTAEQMLLAAYWRGKATEDSDLIEGSMAAVGMTWSEALQRCPKGIYPACHNGEDSVTISGPRDEVKDFVAKLKAENIFAREVDARGYAYHCKYVSPIAEKLQVAMKKVVPNPKPRSSRWISSSFPEDKWNDPESSLADASYFVHNLVSPVLFRDALTHVPKNAIVIEIGPHHLLQSILKREIGKEAVHIGLMKRNADNVEHLLLNVGKLYTSGLDPDIEKLYPPVSFPVPRNTPMISPLLKWDHSHTWKIHKWNWDKMTSEFVYEIEPTIPSDCYFIDYIIDGCHIFPPLGYIVLIWKTFAKIKLVEKMTALPIVFQNIKFLRTVPLPIKGKTIITVSIWKTTGDFEISVNEMTVCTGFVSTPNDSGTKCITSDLNVDKETLILNMQDIYKELGVRGYDYGPSFQGIMAANVSGSEAILKSTENWTVFLDSIFQFSTLSVNRRALLLPTRIETLTIDPLEHNNLAEKAIKVYGGIPVKYDDETGELLCGGVYIKRLNTDTQKKLPDKQLPLLEEYKFIPNEGSSIESEDQKKACKEYVNVCSYMSKRILELSGKKNKQISDSLSGLNINDALMDRYLKSESNDFVLLKGLSDIVNRSNTRSIVQNAKEFTSKYINALDSDILSQIFLNESSLRTTSDVVLENLVSNTIKIVEITEGGSSLCSKIHEYISLSAMRDISYSILHSDTEQLSNNSLPPKAELTLWEKKPYLEFQDVDLFVLNNVKSSFEETRLVLQNAAECLKNEGFMLLLAKTRLVPAEVVLSAVSEIHIPNFEDSNLESIFKEMNLKVICKKFDSFTSTLYLLRKSGTVSYKDSFIHVTSGKYAPWMDELKEKMTQSKKLQESSSPERLWLISEGTNESGIVGLVNCLRREPGGSMVRCVFIGRRNAAASPFSLNNPFYKDQFQKDLVMNVFQNGTWGSYRHIRCKDVPVTTETKHAYLNILTIGDLSTLTWVNSSKENSTVTDRCADDLICHVYYASLNFKDVMIASGKLPLRAFPGSLIYKDSVLGIEFSGRTSDGRRVMGIVPHKAISTTVVANRSLLWELPDAWSLEQAATVPVAYATAYYALISRGRLQSGEKVLIHSGSGDVGQAAINIALSLGCIVYTTVGSKEKKEFLKKNFPQLTEEHISSSSDTSFEQHILHATKGKGVNVILNSLAGDKLVASLSCLATHGRFLQIGKYDFAQNSNLGMSIFLKNMSFEGISLDKFLDCNNKNHHLRAEISQLLKNGIAKGVVKPLYTTVFNYNEAEQAFRYMENGQHIGKVVLKIREEEKKKTVISSPIYIKAVVRTTFDPQKSYVIIEGLGEMGLQLSQWLIDRGAQNIVITSRSGVSTGYQKLCLHRWKQNSVNVVISKLNAAKKDETKDMFKLAGNIAPIGGIFNLASVHKHGLMQNQTIQSFAEVCDYKIESTKHMDLLSRDLCPKLDWFVCFSSIASGRGLAGESNCGYADSVTERICEERVREGLPGLAVQWGAIGNLEFSKDPLRSDVKNSIAPQKTSSCLMVLDKFLQQSHPVVSSFVPQQTDHPLV